jgi:hypothetical protein
VHIYIGFESLKVKCTQYGIYSQAAFKNARAMFFSKLGEAGSNFQSGSKKSRAGAKILREGCPRPDLTPPIVRRGDLMSPRHLALLDTKPPSPPSHLAQQEPKAGLPEIRHEAHGPTPPWWQTPPPPQPSLVASTNLHPPPPRTTKALG